MGGFGAWLFENELARLIIGSPHEEGGKVRIAFSQPNVQTLFTVPFQYRVPSYQRAYAWTSTEIDDFWADVSTSGGNGHFLGPMVVFHPEGQETREVIDGQQRLTTLQMLLALIRDKYIELEDGASAQKPHTLIWDEGYESRFRYRTGDANRYVLEQFILAKPDDSDRRFISDAQHLKQLSRAERARNRPLTAAWSRLKSLLDDYVTHAPSGAKAATVEIEQKLVKRVFAVVMELEQLDDAFLLFETLNDRGLALSAADLLKSHLLSGIDQKHGSDPAEIAKASAIWDEMLDALGRPDITGYLRHYLLMEQPRVKKSDVFPFFKDEVRQSGPDKVLDDLTHMGKLYAEFERPLTVDSQELRVLFTDLLGTGVDTHRVALLPARRYVGDEKKFLNFGRLCEILSFRWTVTGGNAQELESLYQEAASIIRKSGGDQIAAAEEILVRRLPPDGKFEEYFRTQALGYVNVAAYVLRKLENALVPGEKQILPPARVHVEHIMPVTPTLFWKTKVLSDDDYDSVIRRWGNLTLLQGKLNETIRNGDWSTKTGPEGYASSKIQLTRDLLSLPDWDSREVELRARWLARVAVRVWNRESNLEGVPSLIQVRANPKLVGFADKSMGID